MEKPLYPFYDMNIIKGYQEGSNSGNFAIHNGGKKEKPQKIRAPYTGTIRKISAANDNEILLESIEPVEYPDGTIDYMTILFTHGEDISNLFVGKRIKQGEEFYNQGIPYCHIECGKGRFIGTGTHKNKEGNDSINNAKKPEECLWIDNSVNIINNNQYQYRKIIDSTVKYPITEINKTSSNQAKRLIFICPKTDLYGIYLKENQKLYIEN